MKETWLTIYVNLQALLSKNTVSNQEHPSNPVVFKQLSLLNPTAFSNQIK